MELIGEEDEKDVLNKVYETSRKMLDIQKFEHGILNDVNIGPNSVKRSHDVLAQIRDQHKATSDNSRHQLRAIVDLDKHLHVDLVNIRKELVKVNDHLKAANAFQVNSRKSDLELRRTDKNERETRRLERLKAIEAKNDKRREFRSNSIWLRRIEDVLSRVSVEVATKSMDNIFDPSSKKSSFGKWLTDFTLGRAFGTRLQAQNAVKTETGIKVETATWNTKDSTALTVVIPGWLSKIHTALTGSNETFDYRSGLFRSSKDVMEQEDKLASRRLREAQKRIDDFSNKGFFSSRRFLKLQKELEDERKQYSESLRSSELQSLTSLATGNSDNRITDRMKSQGAVFDNFFGTDVRSSKDIQDNLSKYRTGLEKLLLNATGLRGEEFKGKEDIINALRSMLPGTDIDYAVNTTDIDFSKMLDANSKLNPLIRALDAMKPGTKAGRMEMTSENIKEIREALLEETSSSRLKSYLGGDSDESRGLMGDVKSGELMSRNPSTGISFLTENLYSSTEKKPWLQLIYEHMTGVEVRSPASRGTVNSSDVKAFLGLGREEDSEKKSTEVSAGIRSTINSNEVKGFLELRREEDFKKKSMEANITAATILASDSVRERKESEETREWRKDISKGIDGIKARFDRNALINLITGLGGKLLGALGLVALYLMKLPSIAAKAIRSILSGGGAMMGTMGAYIASKSKRIYGIMTKGVENLFSKSWGRLEGLKNNILTFNDSLRTTLTESSKRLMENGREMVTSLKEISRTAAKELLESGKSIAERLKTSSIDIIKGIKDNVIQSAKNAKDALTSNTGILGGIKDRISSTVDSIKSGSIVSKITDSNVIKTASEKAGGWFSSAKEKAGGWLNAAKDKAGSVVNSAKGVINNGIDAVKSAGSGVINSALEFIKDGFKSIVNSVSKFFDSGFGRVAKILGRWGMRLVKILAPLEFIINMVYAKERLGLDPDYDMSMLERASYAGAALANDTVASVGYLAGGAVDLLTGGNTELRKRVSFSNDKDAFVNKSFNFVAGRGYDALNNTDKKPSDKVRDNEEHKIEEASNAAVEDASASIETNQGKSDYQLPLTTRYGKVDPASQIPSTHIPQTGSSKVASSSHIPTSPISGGVNAIDFDGYPSFMITDSDRKFFDRIKSRYTLLDVDEKTNTITYINESGKTVKYQDTRTEADKRRAEAISKQIRGENRKEYSEATKEQFRKWANGDTGIYSRENAKTSSTLDTEKALSQTRVDNANNGGQATIMSQTPSGSSNYTIMGGGGGGSYSSGGGGSSSGVSGGSYSSGSGGGSQSGGSGGGVYSGGGESYSSKKIAVPSKPEVEKALLKAMTDNGITDPKEQAAIMGQTAHESGNFTTIEENLRYRPATLNKLFKSVKGIKHAEQIVAGGPPAIAEHVYGGRKDLGNTSPGDGWKYRGRGYIQLTGKANYAHVSKTLGIDLLKNPDLVSTDPNVAAAATIAWWKRQGTRISEPAKRGDTKTVSKIVNGGYNGLEDRIGKTNYYMQKIHELRGSMADSENENVASASMDTSVGTGENIASASPDTSVGAGETKNVATATLNTSPSTSDNSSTLGGSGVGGAYEYLDSRPQVASTPVGDAPKMPEMQSAPQPISSGPSMAVDTGGIQVAERQLTEAEKTNILLAKIAESLSGQQGGDHSSTFASNNYNIGGNTINGGNRVLGSGPSGNTFDIGISSLTLMEAAS